MYKENPKTKGSGIISAIPQTGICPMKCPDCFFQSGRSYLEPLADNLPNMPTLGMAEGRVVRVNDGNDSNNHPDLVIRMTAQYKDKFYNTSIPIALNRFDAPVVLTVNPGERTDIAACFLELIPINLMFVRFRVNTWNLDLAQKVVDYYSAKEIPIVLTFMAYYEEEAIPWANLKDYMFRKRTENSYHAITTAAWEYVMGLFKYNKWVYSCGKIEGEKGITLCRHCGNCLREYFATKERIRGGL